jgi:glutathione S-transferase
VARGVHQRTSRKRSMATFEESSHSSGDAPWELYYWANVKEDGRNHMIGRGEFVRLMFEVAGVPFIDHGVKDMSEVVHFLRGGGNVGFPIFAPPAIKKGDFVLSQTPVIVKYLGQEFGLYPTNKADEAHAESLEAFVTDFICEGRLVFHAKQFTKSYYDQVEETKDNVTWFATERLPQFLGYLEKVLVFNNSQEGNSLGFFIGNSMTYVDVAVFHTLEAAASQFPDRFQEISGSTPQLVTFRSTMLSHPRIAAYLASDRRGFFEGNSMM